jgi:cyanophycinase
MLRVRDRHAERDDYILYMLPALIAFLLAADPLANANGALVAVGGGSTTPAITQRTLELAGGRSAKILVVPQASAQSDGSSSAEMWKELGAQHVTILKLDDADSVKAVESANLIWMPGGDQNRLMKALPAGVIETIRKRFRAGAVVGGTSAGAAVLSQVMITGEADLRAIRRGATQTADGLALWPKAIVDQHFVRRQRFNRLLSAVLDRPELVGVGVDESTAAILRGSKLEVVGAAQVLIIDARKATIPAGKTGDLGTAVGVELHVLTNGMTFDFDKK